MVRKVALLIAVMLVAACSQIGIPGGAVVPTTGNTSSDASAAQQFVPDLPGYMSINATSVTSALSTVSGGASILSGNVVTAAMVAQIDGMINCYEKVGAVAAKIYAQPDIASVAAGQVPAVGVLAVINENRLVNNFLPCALGSGQGMSAQAATPQPCAGSGSFTVNNETLWYLYAATHQELCTAITAKLPQAQG